ncbi:MAG: hypothetical protein HY655_11755, partial [Acidobacteria bacterium]|nr:hypothetical protein [Acidobacteriota bacterium]
AAITTAVLGTAVLLASQLQQAYTTELDSATVEEELRFTLDWIGQALRNTGSDPYGTSLTPIVMNPDNANGNDDIRIRADINPPDGDVTDANEDITIALDAGDRVITRTDNGVGGTVDMTEPVITGLLFTYLDSDRNVTAAPGSVAYVRVTITGQSPSYNAALGQNPTRTLEAEFRLRTRP